MLVIQNGRKRKGKTAGSDVEPRQCVRVFQGKVMGGEDQTETKYAER